MQSQKIILQSSQASDYHVIIYPAVAHLEFLEIIFFKMLKLCVQLMDISPRYFGHLANPLHL